MGSGGRAGVSAPAVAPAVASRRIVRRTERAKLNHTFLIPCQVRQQGCGRFVDISGNDRFQLRFDQAFGKGTGKKVNLRCDRKGLISELWVNLSGDITNKTAMSELLENAVDAGSSCKVGKVDRANR